MRALYIVLLSGMLAGLAAPAHALDSDWQDCSRKDQDWATQIAACSRILARGARETPSSRATAHFQRGFAYLREGDGERAIVDYREAIRLKPEFTAAYIYRGFVYSHKGDQDRAIADYDEAIRLNPKVAEAYVARGRAYSAKDDQDHAIADYGEAIRLDPKNTVAYIDRGRVYLLKGDPDRAITDFGEAIRRDPRNAFAYRNRARAHSDKGDKDHAIADYGEVIRLDPKDAVAYNNRGFAYSDKGDLDRAIADYSEAIRLNPINAPAYSNRGRAYLFKGEPDRAIADIGESIRLDPKNSTAYIDRALAYFVKGDQDRVIADYSAAIRLDPKYVAAYNGRGHAYLDKGDQDRAIADFDEAIRLDPKNADAFGNRGVIYEQRRDFARARVDFEAAVAAQPGDRVGTAGLERLHAMAPEIESRPVGPAAADAVPPQAAPHVEQGRRIALVVGNDAYPHLSSDRQLRNALNDARTVGRALEALGFSVTVRENLDRETFLDALSDFSARIGRGDTAFFFYSGHGVSLSGGANYLLPSDFPAPRAGGKDEEQRLADRALAERGVIERMQSAGARVAMVVLDACRDNPLALANKKSVGATRGLAPPPAVEGLMSIYSAGVGQSALDRLSDADSDKNSVFTRVFVEMLKTPGLTHRDLAVRTREKVKALALKAGYSQTPGYYEEIDGDVYLAGR